MKDDDVMIRVTLEMTRNGSHARQIAYPSGPIIADRSLLLGMLSLASSTVATESFKMEPRNADLPGPGRRKGLGKGLQWN